MHGDHERRAVALVVRLEVVAQEHGDVEGGGVGDQVLRVGLHAGGNGVQRGDGVNGSRTDIVSGVEGNLPEAGVGADAVLT